MVDAERSVAVFQFTFTVNGAVDETEVLEVSGLKDESDVTEHKLVTGGFKESVEKIPGRATAGDLTITRAIMAGNMDFWTWRQTVVDGNFTRQTASIIGYDVTNAQVAQWDFEGCWPTKVEGPEFDSENSQYVTEKLTIAYESYKRTQ
jgi:phage tail-like protein